MRFIGSIPDDQLATRFSDYLVALGINNQVEQGSSGFAIWVHDDDQIERSKAELATFLNDPNRPMYGQASNAAQRVRDDQLRKEESLRKNYIDYRTRFAGLANKPAPLTIALIIACLLVAFLTQFGESGEHVERWLRFGNLTTEEQVQDVIEIFRRNRTQTQVKPIELIPPGAQDVLGGQVWRIVTPMFMHFGLLHLAFNMLWLWDLGRAIERVRGTLAFLGIVLATSALSNIAQFYWSGPYFGGMSGVVYGLFGYIWVKTKVEPHLGFRLNPQTVLIMMAWLVLCAVGFIPNVANAAHVIGLIVGMVLAHAPYSWRRMKQQQRAVR
jgi:GlpG protein